jgi:hypothetical protein
MPKITMQTNKAYLTRYQVQQHLFAEVVFKNQNNISQAAILSLGMI